MQAGDTRMVGTLLQPKTAIRSYENLSQRGASLIKINKSLKITIPKTGRDNLRRKGREQRSPVFNMTRKNIIRRREGH
jgi:hypothetical protein